MCQAHVLGDFEAPAARHLQTFEVGVGGNVVAKEEVQVGIKAPARHNCRTLKFQRAACSIARVSKERFLFQLALGIELLKTLPRHQHLAAYLEACRVGQFVAKLERY